MKKILTMLIICVMCVAYAGCGATMDQWVDEGAAKMDGDVRSGEFVLNGTKFSFPMPLSVLLENGWSIPDEYSNKDDFELEAYSISTEFELLNEKGKYIIATVMNNSDESSKIEKCMIYGLRIYMEDHEIVLPGGMNRFSVHNDVKETYGVPDSETRGTYGATDGNMDYEQYSYQFKKDGWVCFANLKMVPGEKLSDPLKFDCVEYGVRRVDYSKYFGGVDVDVDFCVNYIDSTMRTCYYGDWKNYVDMGNDTEAGAKKLFESEIKYYANALMSYVGVEKDYMNAKSKKAFEEIAATVLQKVKWEITDVGLDEDTLMGSFKIKLYPTNYVDVFSKPLDDAIMEFLKERQKVKLDKLDKKERTEYEQEYADTMIEVLKKSIAKTKNAKPVVKVYPIDCLEGVVGTDIWDEIDNIIMGMSK